MDITVSWFLITEIGENKEKRVDGRMFLTWKFEKLPLTKKRIFAVFL